jgi:hypothetical protein
MWTHGNRRSPTREGDWSPVPAGPPLSPPEPRLHHFSAASSTRLVGRRGHRRRLPNDCKKRKTWRTKGKLRVKFRGQFAPTGLACPGGGQEIDRSRSERGKLERHPMRDRSCDVLRGSSPGEAVETTFLAENWNRRTVGEAWCAVGCSRRKTLAGRARRCGIAVGGVYLDVD